MTARISDQVLPTWDGVLPPWPGREVAGLYVRRTPGAANGGEPALFVHGLGGGSTNWTDVMGLLGDTLDSEAVDLPGFGRSQPPTGGDFSLDNQVNAVVAHLERSDRGPVHLFGNSLGGAVSTRLAAQRPDLVSTLTLISPALPNLRPKRGSDPRLPLLLIPGVSTLTARALAKRTPEARARAVLALCFADLSRIPQERIDEAVAEVVRRDGLPWAASAFTGALRGLIGSYLEWGPRSLWRQAATVKAPTLLIWGDQDKLVDVALAPRARRTFPDARLLVLPDTGHVAQLERADVVARAFLGMQEELRERPAGYGQRLAPGSS